MPDHAVGNMRGRSRAAAIGGLLTITMISAPTATAAAQDTGTDTGKAAQMQRLEQATAGAGRRPLTTAFIPQLSTAASPAVRTAAAAAATPPASTPGTPVVTGTNGVVSVTASSTAPYVSFAADGTAISGPVQASSDTATINVPTWGWVNGAHAITAVDCADPDPASCNTAAPASTTFDLANAGPTITAPANGAPITGGFTITASSAGGGVRFLIDGVRRGFDASSPYTFAYTGSALSAGSHRITAVQCSTDEQRCDGPTSAPVSITADSLHPAIASISPRVFSPNGDRYKDSTTVTYSLPDTETVHISVANSRGTVVRGPSRLGTLTKGTRTWTWAGRASSGKVVPSGTYRITLSTSATVNGAVVRGLVWRNVVVDNRAPSVTSISYNATVYPYRDGYKDALTVKLRLNERATTTLTVFNSTRHVVRTLRSTHDAGMVTLSWNARDAHNRLVKVGTYYWRLAVRDGVGNSARTALHRFGVSSKRLISKSVTLLRNGDSFYEAGASDPSCAEASASMSEYAHGVWLANTCYSGLAGAFYHVNVPAAVVYSRFTVQVYGWALYAPTSMATVFGVRGGSSDFGVGGLYEIGTQREGWYTIGAINAANYVSSTHRTNIGVTVTDHDAPCDFDIKQVRIHLSYKVLG